jgi:deoxyribose-phosphate aldolase
MNPTVQQPYPNWCPSPPVDQVGVEERVARLNARSIKKESKVAALKLALSMLDLTTLEGSDSPGKVRQLCYKAMHLHDALPGLPHVAALCVYPALVRIARQELGNSGIKVASVATAFPSGQSPRETRMEEIRYAMHEGADEIDMVISRGAFLRGDLACVYYVIAEAKSICGGNVHLKVILETGELGSLDRIRQASDLALAAGGDFIKTSTGKVQPAATLPVTLVMLEAIRDFRQRTGKKRGMKPAGGIRNAKTSIQYLVLLNETLGHEWMTPDLFRIGASTLANDILMQLVKETTGVYQSLDYFSQA